jgi:hypothetical protein
MGGGTTVIAGCVRMFGEGSSCAKTHRNSKAFRYASVWKEGGKGGDRETAGEGRELEKNELPVVFSFFLSFPHKCGSGAIFLGCGKAYLGGVVKRVH